MNLFEKFKVFNLVNKCKNFGLFKEAQINKSWVDKDGNNNAEIIITNNEGNPTQINVIVKDDVIIAIIPLSGLSL